MAQGTLCSMHLQYMLDMAKRCSERNSERANMLELALTRWQCPTGIWPMTMHPKNRGQRLLILRLSGCAQAFESSTCGHTVVHTTIHLLHCKVTQLRREGWYSTDRITHNSKHIQPVKYLYYVVDSRHKKGRMSAAD